MGSFEVNHLQLLHPLGVLRITARMILLLLLATVRGVVFLIEQPSLSLMMAVPYVKWMAKILTNITPWQVCRLLLVLIAILQHFQRLDFDQILQPNLYSFCELCILWQLMQVTMRQLQLSFMGSYGHDYMKPTVVFGSAFGPHRFLGLCNLECW